MKEKNEIKSKDNLLIFLLILIIIVFATILYIKITHKTNYEKILNDIKIDETQITSENTERMLKVKSLKSDVNNDIVGWLEIEDTNITYPVLQTNDNDYYMRHTYNKSYSIDGSIFLDKDYKWTIPSSNLLIYGHNNKNGNMFQELLNYKEESYYLEHPNIRFTTIIDDSNYEIISVFLSRVYYKDEQNVFRYYYFINARDEQDYNNYVEESKKASLYDTGKTAKYGDQLLTLSTCEYSQEDGRFVVLARKID